jgi:hypothetical protein
MGVQLYSVIMGKQVKAILDQGEVSIARTSWVCKGCDAYDAENYNSFSKREREFYGPLKMRLARIRNFWDFCNNDRRPKYVLPAVEKKDKVKEGYEVYELDWSRDEVYLWYDCEPIGKLVGYMHQIGVRGRHRTPIWKIRRHYVEHRTKPARTKFGMLREGFYVRGLSRPKDWVGIRCDTIEDAEMLVNQLDRAPESAPYVEGELNASYFTPIEPAAAQA